MKWFKLFLVVSSMLFAMYLSLAADPSSVLTAIEINGSEPGPTGSEPGPA